MGLCRWREKAVHEVFEFGEIKGLADVEMRSELQRAVRDVPVIGATQHDDARGWLQGFELLQGFYAIQSGHQEVEQHDIGLKDLDQRKRFFSALHDSHLEPLAREIVSEKCADFRLVINDQHLPRELLLTIELSNVQHDHPLRPERSPCATSTRARRNKKTGLPARLVGIIGNPWSSQPGCSFFGSSAIFREDPWLCVPASRRVCLYRIPWRSIVTSSMPDSNREDNRQEASFINKEHESVNVPFTPMAHLMSLQRVRRPYG